MDGDAGGTWKKHRLTAARIHRILKDEHGFTGGKSTVRRAVREIRLELGLSLTDAYVPLVYDPAADGQADFFEADVRFQGEIVRCSFFLLRACYSTRPFVCRVPAENQESLFASLHAGFEHFGGIFHKLWFDNLSLVVDKILRRRSRKLQKRFEDFRMHYSFECEFCAPAKGNEKGGVERGVAYTRRNALTPVPEIEDWSELDAALATWMRQEDQRVPAGRSKTVLELWIDEETSLIPLPGHAFDAARFVTRKVSPYSLVRFKNNYYSVPVALVSAPVTVKCYAESLEIHCPNGDVVKHPRLYGNGETSFRLEHYLDLLEWKPRAFDRAAPVRAASRSWPAAFPLLLRVLRSRLGDIEGTRSFIQVLRLHEFHSAPRVHWAVRRALTHEQPSHATVLSYLDVGRRAALPHEELSQDELEAYPPTRVDDGDPGAYEQLSSGMDT